MTRAQIRVDAALPGLPPRGTVTTVEVTDRLLRRAANGLVTILSTDADDDLVEWVAGATINDVLRHVDAGEVTAEDALAAEDARRGRTGLVEALRARLADDGGEEDAEMSGEEGGEDAGGG